MNPNANQNLEKKCRSCKGRGGEIDCGSWQPCKTCGGSGYVPTKDGEKLLLLVRHNINRLIVESAST